MIVSNAMADMNINVPKLGAAPYRMSAFVIAVPAVSAAVFRRIWRIVQPRTRTALAVALQLSRKTLFVFPSSDAERLSGEHGTAVRRAVLYFSTREHQ